MQAQHHKIRKQKGIRGQLHKNKQQMPPPAVEKKKKEEQGALKKKKIKQLMHSLQPLRRN